MEDKPAWTIEKVEITPEAVRRVLQGIGPDSPAEEKTAALTKAVEIMACMDPLDRETMLFEVKKQLKLSGPAMKILRGKIAGAAKTAERYVGPPEDPEDEIGSLIPVARSLAHAPDHLTEVETTLRALGLAGQVREGKLVYLALTSRITERPCNVAIKGASSGGKSFLLATVLRLFPESAFYALSGMSEKSLAYSQEPLAHRHLVIYEAAGMGSEFAAYLMRSLLSEGKIRYETVEKTQDGLVPRLIDREGPTGLCCTTTRGKLHPENETRLLSLEVDDSPQQTREVLLIHAEDRQLPDLAHFQAYQRILELTLPQAVVPYAVDIARECDPTAVRLRRDYPMVLTLIKTHAVLNAKHRQVDDQGRVVANEADYRVIHQLVADLVAHGTGAQVSDTVRETVRAVEVLLEDDPRDGDQRGVSIVEIANYLKRDESSIRTRVYKAANYLINQESRKGRPAKIVLGDPLPGKNRPVLPEPEKIFSNSLEPLPDSRPTLKECQPWAENAGNEQFWPTPALPPLDYQEERRDGGITAEEVTPAIKAAPVVENHPVPGRRDAFSADEVKNILVKNTKPTWKPLILLWNPERQRGAAAKLKSVLPNNEPKRKWPPYPETHPRGPFGNFKMVRCGLCQHLQEREYFCVCAVKLERENGHEIMAYRSPTQIMGRCNSFRLNPNWNVLQWDWEEADGIRRANALTRLVEEDFAAHA